MPQISNTQEHNSWQTIASSLVGGAAGGWLFFPPEGLKKRFQSQQLTITDAKNLTANFKKALHPFQLYKGATSFAGAVMVATVTSMGFNRSLQEISFYDSESSIHKLAAACSSGALGALFGSTPVENTILTQQRYNTNPLSAFKIMLKEGLLRPWTGAKELMAREAGFAGVMLFGAPAVYETVEQKTNNKTLANAASVGLGVLGALATHAPDTVATHRQENQIMRAKKAAEMGSTEKIHPMTTLQAIREIFQQHGVKGFYKGAACRCVLFTGCALVIPPITKAVREIL